MLTHSQRLVLSKTIPTLFRPFASSARKVYRASFVTGRRFCAVKK